MENLLGVPYTLGMFVFKKKNFLWLQVFKYLNLNTKKWTIFSLFVGYTSIKCSIEV